MDFLLNWRCLTVRSAAMQPNNIHPKCKVDKLTNFNKSFNLLPHRWVCPCVREYDSGRFSSQGEKLLVGHYITLHYIIP